MRYSVATIGLAGLAAAAPSSPPSQGNLDTSKGLQLRVKLQDASKDLPSPVAGQYVTTIHDGAGTNLVGFSAGSGRVFYNNGTEGADRHSWALLSDIPDTPYGISLITTEENHYLQVARMDVGKAPQHIYVEDGSGTATGGGGPGLNPPNWLACEEPLAYYGGKKFNTLRHSVVDALVPEECVKVALLPECAELNELPPGSRASHEYARTVSCYKDASV
ncbi:hypothetical protein NLG97_g2014 [Lecanicillium saksenae]|uniref:Uncharacterized protein n=1 Tax=Lecanicillium saksenae TaxID=468837 RepID=A0ACC1R5I5_9HYPO|nr:hypothetical protein NLG97_g2014 [Lecanicillium saksenae]